MKTTPVSKLVKHSLHRLWQPLAFALALTATAGLHAQSIIQEFFVPMPEAQLQTSLRAIDTTGTPVGNDLKVTIALVTGTTNTIVVYDHWGGWLRE